MKKTFIVTGFLALGLLGGAGYWWHCKSKETPQGAQDPRVKKAESDQIVQALESRGIEVPYLVKENEGHGFHNEENRMEFYSLMEAFLEQGLK